MEMGSYAAMRSMAKLVMIALVLGSAVELSSSASSLREECGAAIEKVTSCLSYATGKAAEPTKECCDAVTGIKAQQPVCLCFFIGQAHNGSQQIKSLGIQEAKLLQLPSACHITNVNMTKCPKLLGISPTSPAAAIFMNSNVTTSSSTSSPSSTSSLLPTGGAADNSRGLISKHENFGLILGFIPLVILLCGLPLGHNPAL